MRFFPATACTLVFIASTAYGSIITYTASLSGPNEAPPNASPGIGFTVVTLNTTLNTLEVNVTFSGLLGPTTASHIHCCTAIPGVGTAAVATTTPSFTGFPLGVTSGSFDSILDLAAASSWNPAFIATSGGTIAGAEAVFLAGLAAGDTYLNIHSTVDPGGEIRGFLVAAPEPSTFAMGAGLLGVWVAVRRYRGIR